MDSGEAKPVRKLVNFSHITYLVPINVKSSGFGT